MTAPRPRWRRPAVLGFGGWAMATLALRLLPRAALRLPPAGWLAAIVVLLVALAVVARWIVRGAEPAHRAAIMVALVLPGMLGDAAATAGFAQVFPNLPPAGAACFAALMLLAYAIMLAAALAPASRGAPAGTGVDPTLSA